MTDTKERTIPKSIDSEQALLGNLLMHNDLYRKVANVIAEEHFFEEIHQRIWNVLKALIERGSAATPALCATYLGDDEIEENTGVTPQKYMAQLVIHATVGSASILDFATVLRDLWVRREMITFADQVKALSYDAPAHMRAEEIFTKFEGGIEARRPRIMRSSDDFVPFDVYAEQAVQKANDAYKAKGSLIGLSTGMSRLDDMLAGLQGPDLIILAGRPGMGKTALAAKIAFNVALELKRTGQRGQVGFVSLEMGGDQLAMRAIADEAQVAGFRLRRGFAEEDEVVNFIEVARGVMREIPLQINQTGGLAIGTLRSQARSLKRRKGLALLVVDYLQLLTAHGNHWETNRRDVNRVQEVTDISKGLKEIAKELDVPVIALSQLGRQVDERPGKRPQLTDLRESGSIEQDADTVMLVFREEYYLQKEKPREGSEHMADWDARMERVRGLAEVLIPKNRHGPEGIATLGFEGAYTRFTNDPPVREREPEKVARGTRPPKSWSPKKESLAAIGALRNATKEQPLDPKEVGLSPPKGVVPVDYEVWKKKCATGILDPGATDAAIASFMKTAFVDLSVADNKGDPLVERVEHEGKVYVWLTERGQKV